jgi:predicted nucleic-acid-binding Zn-ribbon protein
MARPRKEVDWETVNKLCGIHCTGEEIANFLDMSYDTLQRRCLEEHECGFADYYKKASSNGKISLRREQYSVAMKGNVSMLIWLGKNILGQKDAPEQNLDRQPIHIIFGEPDADTPATN